MSEGLMTNYIYYAEPLATSRGYIKDTFVQSLKSSQIDGHWLDSPRCVNTYWREASLYTKLLLNHRLSDRVIQSSSLALYVFDGPSIARTYLEWVEMLQEVLQAGMTLYMLKYHFCILNR